MPLLTINIIGCGRLGRSIARLFSELDVAEVQGVVNASIKSAISAIEFIGHGTAYETLEELPTADIYLIATRDDDIQTMANRLAESNALKKGAIIVHCSGSLSSDVLNKVKTKDSFVISVHPIKSFADPSQCVKTFSGTYCAIEGDPEATPIITALFEKIGGIVFTINKEHKKLYHAAGVISNNYLTTLHYHALQCYIKAGVDENIAKKIVSMLMNDALNNLKAMSHESALTGPIQRGDIKTVSDHTASLAGTSVQQETRDIYSSLGIGTLSLTRHHDRKKEEFKKVLSSNSSSATKAKL